MSKIYGTELILDLHECDISTFTQESLDEYIDKICSLVAIHRHDKPLFWIDKSDDPRLCGISVLQFISVSNITIHALDLLKTVYINFFACTDFDAQVIEKMSKEHFGSREGTARVIERA
jgi:S-adenosylmethionine/arginine decarboxylase-like enzyme